MRDFIDIISEDRSLSIGEGLWISPELAVIPISEEHHDWMRAAPVSQTHLTPDELWDNPAYSAIRRGWVRVVIFKSGLDTFLAARDWATAKKAFSALVRAKWAMTSRDAVVSVDIYGEDEKQPDDHRRFEYARDLLLLRL